MLKIRVASAALAALLIATSPGSSSAPGPGDPETLLAAQREALAPLSFMDGVWRGPAWIIGPTGERLDLIQTERIGPCLDGTLKVIEGRGHEPGGAVGFQAFAIISFDPTTRKHSMRSYAHGRSGDFVLTPTADGFVWEIPAGPATIRYTATIKDGKWHEVGDRIASGREPVRFFEANLVRIRDTDWPAAGAIGPQ